MALGILTNPIPVGEGVKVSVGVDVFVSVNVSVGIDVFVGVNVSVEVGVNVGLNNCPDLQAENNILEKSIIKIKIRYFIFIMSCTIIGAPSGE